VKNDEAAFESYAAPFTPTANHTVTKVVVGLIEGDYEVTVSLYSDNNGFPRTALLSRNVKKLDAIGCCKVEEVGDQAGIPVTAGTQYWVVVSPTGTGSTTYAAWNVNDTNQVAGTIAVYCSDDQQGSCNTNDAWVSSQYYVPAFAVLGSQ
jgi:hypothetical protein